MHSFEYRYPISVLTHHDLLFHYGGFLAAMAKNIGNMSCLNCFECFVDKWSNLEEIGFQVIHVRKDFAIFN